MIMVIRKMKYVAGNKVIMMIISIFMDGVSVTNEEMYRFLSSTKRHHIISSNFFSSTSVFIVTIWIILMMMMTMIIKVLTIVLIGL